MSQNITTDFFESILPAPSGVPLVARIPSTGGKAPPGFRRSSVVGSALSRVRKGGPVNFLGVGEITLPHFSMGRLGSPRFVRWPR